MIREHEYIVDNIVSLNDNMFFLYIVKGEKNYLIDAGITAKAKIFHQRIQSVLNEKKIDEILLTHSHYDHTGACSYLQEQYDCSIAGSERTIELLKKDQVIQFIDKLNQEFKSIVGDDSDLRCTTLKRLVPLKDQTVLQIDEKRSIKIVYSKGHTKCSASFIQYPEKVLFLGDAGGVKEKTGNIKPLFLSSYSEYTDSINRLIDLEAEYLAFPHNRYIKGKEKVKAYLKNSLLESEKLKDQIILETKMGRETDKIVSNLLAKLFPNPTVFGPKEAFAINFKAMVSAVKKEFLLEDSDL